MAIPGPGTAISMNTIATEFGGTVPHSLSEYYRGGGLVPNSPTNLGIPTSGQIAIGDFYGSQNRVALALTIAANTNNYNAYTTAVANPGYVSGATDVTLTINPGVTVGSTSTPTYALLVPSQFNPGDTVTIINNGLIQGMGGSAGNGCSAPAGIPSGPQPGFPGAAGGSALYVNRPTIVTNNGTIAGGGGGGGGGGSMWGDPSGSKPVDFGGGFGGGGGGGGSGTNGGAGGSGGSGAPGPALGTGAGTPGGAGTSPAGGGGGAGRASPVGRQAGPGGTGGGRGAAGSVGGTAPSTPSPSFRWYGKPGGSGGAAGNYVVGNPFVTWPATGTRQGGVA